MEERSQERRRRRDDECAAKGAKQRKAPPQEHDGQHELGAEREKHRGGRLRASDEVGQPLSSWRGCHQSAPGEAPQLQQHLEHQVEEEQPDDEQHPARSRCAEARRRSLRRCRAAARRQTAGCTPLPPNFGALQI